MGLAALTLHPFAARAATPAAAVAAPAANTAALNAVWSGFIDALKRRDQEAALRYFADKDTYARVLSGMGANMPKFAASMSPLYIVEVGSRTAEGVVDATVNGKTSRHSVQFMFVNGAWLIHSL